MSYNLLLDPLFMGILGGLVATLVIAYLWDRKVKRRDYEAYLRAIRVSREFAHRKGWLTDEDLKWLAEKDEEVRRQ